MTNSRCDDPALPTMSYAFEVGQIEVFTAAGLDRARALFGFAERNNPKRAFLFVSKVLGRHIPAQPRAMRAAFAALADGVDGNAPGPIIITGMAETAIGLGAGVHDAYVARTGRRDVLFLSTTRARFDAPLLIEFTEDHSHASHHLMHVPALEADRVLLRRARTLVMVDDEASTGATLHNLAAGLIGAGLNRLERVHTCVLTDWTGSAGRAQAGAARTPATSSTCLLQGRYVWSDRQGAPRRRLPDADIRRQARVSPMHRQGDGRLGRSSRSSHLLPEGLIEALAGVQGRVNVLGMGEHVWEPFLIAEALECAGHDVVFSATTRSPILPGGAIEGGLVFDDHEGLGITNYLYNVDPDPAGRVVLCVDTALAAVDLRLLRALRPDVVLGDKFIPRDAVADLTRGIAPAPGLSQLTARDGGATQSAATAR